MGEGTNQIKFCHMLKRNACARDATNTHKKRGAKLDCPAARTCHVDIRAGVSRDGAGDELCISLQLRWDRALVEFGRVAVLEIPAKTRNVTAIGKTKTRHCNAHHTSHARVVLLAMSELVPVADRALPVFKRPPS